MLAELIFAGSLLQSSTPPQSPKVATDQVSVKTMNNADKDDPNALLRVKRIYVDNFGDDATSKELQSMIVTALVATKRFKVTENRDRADAILKGTALEKSSQELHAYGESTSVGGASGGEHAEISGSGGSFSGSSNGGFVAHHMGIADSSVNTETINDARLAIRLVSPDGDVIWTSAEESKGAKYKGASADVADKCVKQLLHDVDRLEKNTQSPSAVPPSTNDAKR